MQENTQQCLELAEKIVAVLDGGEVFKKYNRIKQKIFSNSPQNLELDPHLKKIALENRDLQRQLEELKDSLKNSDSLENYLINGLFKIQTKVVPNSTTITPLTVEDALHSLEKAVESKLEANASIREQYTRSNTQLREKISALMSSTNEQLEKIKNRHIEQDHQYRSKAQEVDKQIADIDAEIEKLQSQLGEVEEENGSITTEIHKIDSKASSLKRLLADAEKKNGIAESRYKDLQSTATLLSTELETKINEIKMLHAQQRFNTVDIEEADIDELETVEAELEQLQAEHKRLSTEIKKQRLTLVGIENNEVTKLSTISKF